MILRTKEWRVSKLSDFGSLAATKVLGPEPYSIQVSSMPAMAVVMTHGVFFPGGVQINELGIGTPPLSFVWGVLIPSSIYDVSSSS